MNKFILILLLFCTTVAKAQQINFTSWSNSYLMINSYSGHTSTDAYTLRFEGNGNINVPNWKISVKVKQPILSENGAHTFPTDKISLQPTGTLGQAHPNGVPTIAQIGMPPNMILQQGAELFLIPQSNAPLYNQPAVNQGYYDLQLRFNLTVAGGAYLGTLEGNWTKYRMIVEFRAYDGNNTVIGIREHVYELQLAPLSGTPPVTNQLGIQVAANAVNSLLELNSIQDYQTGTSVVYQNGIAVTTNTDYQIKVRSLQGSFTSALGYTLPLSVVNLTLLPVSGNTATGNGVWLSTSPQVIATGSNTNGTSKNFDLKYSSKPNDASLLDATPQIYSTALQFEIVPL